MNNDNRDNEENENRGPETLNEALCFLVYHSGVFALKVTAIIVAWIIVAESLRSWLSP